MAEDEKATPEDDAPLIAPVDPKGKKGGKKDAKKDSKKKWRINKKLKIFNLEFELIFTCFI